MAKSYFPENNEQPRIERDWTQGSITRNLLSLSWPMLISNCIQMMGPTVDMIWVGKLGSASIAGVGVSSLAVMVVNSLIFGLFTGTTAMIARFVGARDKHTANKVAQQAFAIGAVFSIFTALIGIFLAETILIVLGVESDVVREGAAYMRIQLVGMVTMSVVFLSQSIMQASGDALTPMKISIGFRLFQVALCPFLVFGWWIFPHLGVSGAALSDVIAQGIGGSIALWVLFTGRTRIKITLKNFRFNGNLIWRTVKIGIPSAITSAERTFANLVLVGFIIPFGTLAVAAHTLVQNVDTFIQTLSGGLGTPAGVLAGQNLGAGQPDRAAKTAWISVGLATSVAIAFCTAVWFWATPIIHIFNREPALVEIATVFLKIQIVSYLVWGSVISFTQVLSGIGETMVPMITNMVTVWIVQLPLAYFLPRFTDLGVLGIRWAMVSAIVGRAIIFPIYFKSGRWQRKKV